MKKIDYIFITGLLIVFCAILFIAVTGVNTDAKDLPQVVNTEPIVNISEPEVTPEPVKTLTVAYSLSYEVKEKVTYLGEFKLTAYCSCAKCCGKWADLRKKDEDGNDIVIGASGARLEANHSIAVDPKVIPYGTKVIINGQEYVAEDCGGAIKGNRIDVYFNDHQEALEFGVQTADVYIKEVWK